MDQVALRLDGSERWIHLGSDAEAKKPLEVVVRAFDADVEFATGDGPEAPSSDALHVPAGEGRRLEGRHFFVRATAATRISYRGI